MADYTLIQSGDPDAAENIGALGGVVDVTRLVAGLGLSGYDSAAPSIDIAAGKTAHTLDTALAEWTLDDGTQVSEQRDQVLVVCHLDARTGISLVDGNINSIFVEPNRSNDDQPTVVTNTTNSLPSVDAVKIGEVDTANDVVSSQWRSARLGVLSFPDEAAIDSEDDAGRLPEGTNVYDRANNAQYVITG